MNTTIELTKLERVLKVFRTELTKKDPLYFVNDDMCILSQTYYIKVTDEGIRIRSAEEELELSKEFYYYETLKSIFEDAYHNRKSKKRKKLVKRVDFLLKRIIQECNKNSNKAEEVV